MATKKTIKCFYEAPPMVDTIIFRKAKWIVASVKATGKSRTYYDPVNAKVIPVYEYKVHLRLIR